MDDRAAINEEERVCSTSGSIRLEISDKQLGFVSSPPGVVELKFFRAGGRWTAFVLTEPGELLDAARWLNEQSKGAFFPAPAAEPRVMRVVFENIPLPLSRFLRAVEVKNLSMRPAGRATILTTEHPDDLRATVKETLDADGDAAIRFPELIHACEEEALAQAVSMGYYDDPPACLASDVAERMGIGGSELERLLRQGTARILCAYTIRAIDGKWDAARGQIKKIRGPILDPTVV